MATRRYRTGIENNENSILSKNSTTGSTKAFTSTTTTSLSSTNRSISRSGSNSNSIKTNNTTTKSTVTNAKTTVPSRSVSASSRKPLTDLSTTASNKLNTNRPVTNGSSRTTTTTMTGKNMNTSTKNDGNYVTSSALLSPTPAPSVSKIPGTAYKANNNNSNTVLSGSSTSSTVITLPSITNALRTIYTKDLRDEYKNNYTQVINAKIKKIDWSSNYQVSNYLPINLINIRLSRLNKFSGVRTGILYFVDRLIMVSILILYHFFLYYYYYRIVRKKLLKLSKRTGTRYRIPLFVRMKR